MQEKIILFLLLTIGIEIVKKVYNPTRIIYFALQGEKNNIITWQYCVEFEFLDLVNTTQ